MKENIKVSYYEGSASVTGGFHSLLIASTLQWRHDDLDGISNRRRLDYLLNSLFRRRSKQNIKSPRHRLLLVEFIGDRLIHRIKSQ